MSPRLSDYAELRCLSNFSFLRGASHPDELVQRAHALGYRALALTDECSVAGAVRAPGGESRQRSGFTDRACATTHASGTTAQATHKQKRLRLRSTEAFEILVAWGGIEPPTRGFSIRCSTN